METVDPDVAGADVVVSRLSERDSEFAEEIGKGHPDAALTFRPFFCGSYPSA